MLKYRDKDIEWVWIDLDDTLIDFHANSRAALQRLYDMRGLQRWFTDAQTWIQCYERHNHRLWELYGQGLIDQGFLRRERFLRPLAEGGVEPGLIGAMVEEFDTLYLDYLAEERRLVPGAMELLHTVHALGARVGVLSNGFNSVQHRKIRSSGLGPHIDLTVLSDEIGINKPDPRLYAYAMERCGVADQSKHMMIGDNLVTDIAGAIASGWEAIHFNPKGYEPVALDAPYEPFASLRDIADRLRQG